MNKILVTGGLGFIGNNLISRLLERGSYNIRVLDLRGPERAIAFDTNDVDLHQGDIRDSETIKKAVDGVDTVIHLAAHTLIPESVKGPLLNFETNAFATFQLLETMRKLGVDYLINASTGGAILGDAKPPVHEDMPARPLSPYGASKLAAEGYCSAFAGTYGMHTLSLRFANIYGPFSDIKGNAVPIFIRKVLNQEDIIVYGDGKQTRDFLYVGDLAESIINAMEKKITGVYQLGTDKGTSINRVLDIIKSTAGDDFKSRVIYKSLRPGEILHSTCQITKAEEAFGFAPTVSIDQGIEKTYAWFRKHHKTQQEKATLA